MNTHVLFIIAKSNCAIVPPREFVRNDIPSSQNYNNMRTYDHMRPFYAMYI